MALVFEGAAYEGRDERRRVGARVGEDDRGIGRSVDDAGRRAGGDRLLVLVPRLAEMDVRIDEAYEFSLKGKIAVSSQQLGFSLEENAKITA